VDGSRVVNTETGAAYRCNPDGTELEIFALGLRNPQELAFDKFGNLFTWGQQFGRRGSGPLGLCDAKQ
jgi:quinoprotein glucose dehydrogenase